MAGEGIDLDREVIEVGKQLAEAPKDVDELAILLELAESTLFKVDQSPSPSMSIALHPLMNALVDEDLLKHQDMDVKIAVASNICEIIRITAPDAPYSDKLMKKIFSLIVEVLKDLDDKYSHLYYKRLTILETISRIRACVIMLDLECDNLILEMFSHFLKDTRSEHSEKILSFMESIMTLVIEESEDISYNLLRCLLDSVKTDNLDNAPATYKLGEKVIRSCSKKLKPYFVEILQSKADFYGGYSEVVSAICREETGGSEQTDLNSSEEHSDSDKLDGERPQEPDDVVTTPGLEVNNGSLQQRSKESVGLNVELQSHDECTSGSHTSLSLSKKRRPPRSKLSSLTKEESLVNNQYKEERFSKGNSSKIEDDKEMKLQISGGRTILEELEEKLIGSRIKVWWPDDKLFYSGYVDAFYPVTNKHKIVYDDGDVEVLLLKDENWEFVEKRRRGLPGPDPASEEPEKKKAKSPDLVPKSTLERPSRRSRTDKLDSGGYLSKGCNIGGMLPRTLSASDLDPSGYSEPGEKQTGLSRTPGTTGSRLKEPDYPKDRSPETRVRPDLDNSEAGFNSRDVGLDVKAENKSSAGASNVTINGKTRKAGKSEGHDKCGNERNRHKLCIRPPVRDSSSLVGFI